MIKSHSKRRCGVATRSHAVHARALGAIPYGVVLRLRETLPDSEDAVDDDGVDALLDLELRIC